MRWTAVLGVLAAATILTACGGSGSGTGGAASTSANGQRDSQAVSKHDVQVAAALTRHGHSWEAAYDRWDKAYRANHRAVFLVTAARETPTMRSEADGAYRAAISVNDVGIRGHYVKLAKWYLRQTATIDLINTYVKRSSLQAFKAALHKLDRIRAEGPTLGESFQTYVQRRFGTNPFSDLGG